MPRLEKSRRQMWRTERDQNDHHHYRREGQRYSETPGMLWPEGIEQAHDQEHADRCERNVVAQDLDPRDILSSGSDVAQCRPTAESSRYRQVSNEQQRPYHREQASL